MGEWLDDVARALATGRSRRALLRGALGAAAAAALGSLTPWEPSATSGATPTPTPRPATSGPRSDGLRTSRSPR